MVVKVFQNLPQMKFTIVKVPQKPGRTGLSTMFGLTDTVTGLNIGNFYYHKSFSEHYPNLVLIFVYLKDLYDVDMFNISGVYTVK